MQADERELRARGDEAADEVLRQHAVDLRRRLPGGSSGAVGARVEDVDVEAVLVRGVAEPAVVASRTARRTGRLRSPTSTGGAPGFASR